MTEEVSVQAPECATPGSIVLCSSLNNEVVRATPERVVSYGVEVATGVEAQKVYAGLRQWLMSSAVHEPRAGTPGALTLQIGDEPWLRLEAGRALIGTAQREVTGSDLPYAAWGALKDWLAEATRRAALGEPHG